MTASLLVYGSFEIMLGVTGDTVELSDTLEANGQGFGSGGNITLDATGDTRLDLTEGQQIYATGGDSGNGGTITLPNVGQFNVEEVIDVAAYAGGFAAAIKRLHANDIQPRDVSFSNVGGILESNGVPCQLYYVDGGSNAYPLTYWNCANPDAATPTDEVPATWLANASSISGIEDALFPAPVAPGASTTSIWVFTNAAQANTVFDYTGAGVISANSGGYMLPWIDSNSVQWNRVHIFESVTAWGGSQSPSNQQITINTAHEMGHVLDNYSGLAWSINSTYTGTYLIDDGNQLTANTGLGTYDQGASTIPPAANPPPCSTNNMAAFDGQPVFAGSVINSNTNEPICDEIDGTLNSGTNGTGSGNLPTTSNLNIAINASPDIYAGPAEIFAEAFAWSAYTKTLTNPQYGSGFSTSGYFEQTLDGLFANGYFGCALAYANYAVTGSLLLPGYCH